MKLIISFFSFEEFFLDRTKKHLNLKKSVQNEKEEINCHKESNHDSVFSFETTASSAKHRRKEEIIKEHDNHRKSHSFDNLLVNEMNNQICLNKNPFESEKYELISQQIIQELIDKNNNNLDDYDLIYEEKKLNNGLKIFLQSRVNSQNFRINTYRSEWLIPCTPQQFIDFLNDLNLQKKIDNNIDLYECVEQENKNIVIVYLSYKKILFSSPREFVYLKSNKKINEQNNIWCCASKSLEYDSYPKNEKKIRAEIILSGHVITPINEKVSKVNVYSEMDLKINLPLWTIKTTLIHEMKNYIDKIEKYYSN